LDKKPVLTFDCYGTLIDWKSGITDAFKLVIVNDSAKISKIFDAYDQEERRIEKLSYRPYRQVMREAFKAAAATVGIELSIKDSDLLAEQLPHWQPFIDTNTSLDRLAKKYSLGLLSNVDNDLLRETMKHFTVNFDFIITAEKVRSYKPDFPHFTAAQKIIGHRKWTHIAASLYHDISPASSLGIDSVWVNREHVGPDIVYRDKIKEEVKDLRELTSKIL
jgi:2-haloacid dehalogenase